MFDLVTLFVLDYFFELDLQSWGGSGGTRTLTRWGWKSSGAPCNSLKMKGGLFREAALLILQHSLRYGYTANVVENDPNR